MLLTVNPTLCASTYPDEACISDTANSHCKIIASTEVTHSCADKGLNQKACLENTIQACFYDSDKMQC